jgi:hypothetical protein
MISMFLVNLLVIRFGDERRPVGRLHLRVGANRQDRISGSDRTRCSVVRESGDAAEAVASNPPAL